MQAGLSDVARLEVDFRKLAVSEEAQATCWTGVEEGFFNPESKSEMASWTCGDKGIISGPICMPKHHEFCQMKVHITDHRASPAR